MAYTQAIIFVGLILSISARYAAPDFSGPRIVGGTLVRDRSEFAYQVSIRIKNSNQHFCGGSILDNRHVITASHCCFDNNNEVYPANYLTVVVGDLNIIRPTNTTIVRTVQNIFTHKKYSHKTIENDIAILRVDRNFDTWTPTVMPINLSSKLPSPYTLCTISGWGRLSENQNTSTPNLYMAKVPIMTEQECKTAYGNGIKSGMFCAGFKDGKIDSCQGDSGGPLVCNQQLVGIVSWGKGCAARNYPGVYTDVAKYKSWISDQQKRSSADTIAVSKLFLAILTIFSITIYK